MSDVPPSVLLDPVAQNAVLEDITLLLVHTLPPAWQQCVVVHRALGSYGETLGQVRKASGPGLPSLIEPHPALTELFARLRAGMYEPGRGTWFTARFRLDFPFTFEVSYDYDAEPDWRGRPPATAYAEELRDFARAPESTPPWLGGDLPE